MTQSAFSIQLHSAYHYQVHLKILHIFYHVFQQKKKVISQSDKGAVKYYAELNTTKSPKNKFFNYLY